jgi:hypothetical protein
MNSISNIQRTSTLRAESFTHTFSNGYGAISLDRTSPQAAEEVSAIFSGLIAGVLTFVAIEGAALLLAIIAILVENRTGWFNLGSDRNSRLDFVFLYWSFVPAVFAALTVSAKGIQYRLKRMGRPESAKTAS